MEQRLLLIPRWAGDANSDYYPWLDAVLKEDAPSLIRDSVEIWPPGNASVADRTATVGRALAEPVAATHATAHSAGCLALLRALARSEAQRLEAVVLVAGWWTLDSSWAEIDPWTDISFDIAAARENIGRLIVLLSDNDPYTKDFQKTAQRFHAELGAELRLVPGAGHFNAPVQAPVLQALRDVL